MAVRQYTPPRLVDEVSGDDMAVDRCVCHQQKFDELAPLAVEAGGDLARLMELTGCGTRGGLCIPYLRLMLATGKTRFPIMTIAQVERQLRMWPRADAPAVAPER
jgi:bacterioferritin-associated ferredoxin